VRSPWTRPAARAGRSWATIEQSNPPWDGIASAGSHTSVTPFPDQSRPAAAQVAGMNWAIPWAPTGDTARGSHALSVWTCAAITGAGISGHIDPARTTSPTYAAGTVPTLSCPPPGPVGSPPVGSGRSLGPGGCPR